jgi:hypothetical protein
VGTDKELSLAVWKLRHSVRIPDFLEQCLCHLE